MTWRKIVKKTINFRNCYISQHENSKKLNKIFNNNSVLNTLYNYAIVVQQKTGYVGPSLCLPIKTAIFRRPNEQIEKLKTNTRTLLIITNP